jgi:maleylacetate reductase
MLDFDHTTLGQRVLFGAGRAADNTCIEVARRGAQSLMIIASSAEHPVVQQIRGELQPALVYTDIAPHVPSGNAEAARTAAREHHIDLMVSVGGGSTIGLAKAVALSTGIPIVAIPTTYAGSEATNVWGITENNRKTTGVDDVVLPTTVIYDPTLTATLPADLSVASGLNALAHSIDAMWAPRTDPINQALAIQAISDLAAGLRAIHTEPAAVAGHERTLMGAYLSAVAFASAGSGMHHKICHALGGAYSLPHAQTHAIVLPYVLAYNQNSAPAAATRIAAALGAPSALGGLQALRTLLNAPRALRDIGFHESDIAEAAELTLPVIPPSNPRPVTRESLTTLLTAAWAGTRPEDLQ